MASGAYFKEKNSILRNYIKTLREENRKLQNEEMQRLDKHLSSCN